MASFHVLTSGSEIQEFPVVRKIGFADLRDALVEGFRDFRAMPSHLLFLALIYLVIGIFLFPTSSGQNAAPAAVSPARRLCADRAVRGDRAL